MPDPRGALGAVGLAALLAGCTPSMDWREIRPEGSRARAVFPCRPASHERSVMLAGVHVDMRMFACSAAGTVHALAFADLRDPERVGAALDELARAARDNLRAPSGAASQPAAVPGMTPHPRSSQWRLTGTLPDGRSVQERAVFFSHGTRVYQATMLGPQIQSDAQEQFFGGLRIEP